MKKTILQVTFVFFFVLTVIPVYAQETTTIPEVAPMSESITLDVQYDAILEYFFNKISQKDFLKAYGLMSKTFKKNYSFENFSALLNDAGLISYTSYQWKNVIRIVSSSKVEIHGEFTAPDRIHKIIFVLSPHGKKGIQIDALTGNITIEKLAKRLSSDVALASMVRKDLQNITTFIKKNKYVATYKYLSSTARTRITQKDIRAAFKLFRNSNINVTFSDESTLTINEGFPKLNEQEQMVIQGNYPNSSNRMYFVLVYDYEGDWKLGIFSLSTSSPQ